MALYTTPTDDSRLGRADFVATMNIKQGETVVYLGPGSGFDVFLAARMVGPAGSVIGLDMSEDVITLARKNAAEKGFKPPQVAFVKAVLTEKLPIESNSVDCILSNCIANLLSLEGRVSLLKEVYRILKPEGRVILEDIVAKKLIPDNIKNDISAHFSGPIVVEKYQSILKEAGFSNVVIVETKIDPNVYYEDGKTTMGTSAPLGVAAPKLNDDINEWVGVHQIHAVKCGPPVEKSSIVLSRWWDAYPTAKSSPSFMTAEEIIALKEDHASSAEFVVIDVRRGDHGGGHVRGSDNWAAQTFYDDLPAFYEKYKDTPKVIFYCSKSNGRGPRCAGWYQDYLDSQGTHKSTSYVLKGGVKDWLARYGDRDDLVDRD